MKDSKREVYNEIYGSKKILYKPRRGILSFLYRKFKRFEVNRYQVCYDLLPSGERLLDVGCGDGDFLFMAKDKFKQLYGVDISSMRIAKAKNRAREMFMENKFYFFEQDVDEGLHFPDSFFDAVTCIAVLEHVFNPPRVVHEINRVLKIGGIFIVQVPNIAWLPYRIQLFFGKLPVTGGVYMGADWEHLHNFTKESLSLLLSENRFKIETILCSGIFAKYRKLWVSLLGGDLIMKALKLETPV